MSNLVTLRKINKDRYSHWSRYPSPHSWTVRRTSTGWLVEDHENALAVPTLKAAREAVTRLVRQRESN